MNGRTEAEQMSAEHEARQPAAWAVMDGTKTLVGYHSCSRDKAEAWAREYGFPEVVPLYLQPQPTLTDAEREAVERAIDSLVGVEDTGPSSTRDDDAAACILRSLLDRHRAIGSGERDT